MDSSSLETAKDVLKERGGQARQVLAERGGQAKTAIAERAPEVKDKLIEAGGRAKGATAAAAVKGMETASNVRQRLAETLAETELPELPTIRRRRRRMLGKVFNRFTLGVAAGYVLGARAGRERYDQIMRWVGMAAENPKVQEFTEQAKDIVGEKTGLGRPQSIREVMTASPETLATDATLSQAAKRMRELDTGAIVVVNEQEAVIGIVTDRDIAVRAVAEGKDPKAVKVGEVVTNDLVTLKPTDTVADAVKLMRDKAVRRLPVIEGGKAVGIVSIGDLAVERDRTSALADISAAPPPKQ